MAGLASGFGAGTTRFALCERKEGAEFEILKSKIDEAAQKLLVTRLAPREENGGQDGEVGFFRLEP